MRISILFLPLLFVLTTSINRATSLDTNVFVCMGKGSKKYHYRKSCRGLSNCSTKIHEVTLAKAKEMGRTLCGWED
ncbi:hypothetical protein [Flagellimonas sp.]|uniref:hypothetical protein n=1 Tax=Flagellimonas sp. TaxID=2058762 RepID=UPI003AB4BD6F